MERVTERRVKYAGEGSRKERVVGRGGWQKEEGSMSWRKVGRRVDRGGY